MAVVRIPFYSVKTWTNLLFRFLLSFSKCEKTKFSRSSGVLRLIWQDTFLILRVLVLKFVSCRSLMSRTLILFLFCFFAELKIMCIATRMRFMQFMLMRFNLVGQEANQGSHWIPRGHFNSSNMLWWFSQSNCSWYILVIWWSWKISGDPHGFLIAIVLCQRFSRWNS